MLVFSEKFEDRRQEIILIVSIQTQHEHVHSMLEYAKANIMLIKTKTLISIFIGYSYFEKGWRRFC